MNGDEIFSSKAFSMCHHDLFIDQFNCKYEEEYKKNDYSKLLKAVREFLPDLTNGYYNLAHLYSPKELESLRDEVQWLAIDGSYEKAIYLIMDYIKKSGIAYLDLVGDIARLLFAAGLIFQGFLYLDRATAFQKRIDPFETWIHIEKLLINSLCNYFKEICNERQGKYNDDYLQYDEMVENVKQIIQAHHRTLDIEHYRSNYALAIEIESLIYVLTNQRN